MQRSAVLIFSCLLSFSVLGACLSGNEDEWEKKLSKMDITDVFLKDNEDSYALKVIVPHLLKKSVAMTRDYLHCWTLKDEDKKEWARCLGPMLGKNENKILETCLTGPVPSQYQKAKK